MLNIILADSAVERVPEPLWGHPSVSRRAKLLKKKPGQMLLDRSYHHRAMLRLKDGEKRGRPDIVHFCLLEALGTPLNRVNLLRMIVHTIDNHIIYVNPEVRLPRNYDRFAGLIEQLFELGRVGEGNKTLLELKRGNLRQAVDDVKPSYVMAFTRLGKPQLLHEAVLTLTKTENPLVLVGAFPRGHFSDEVKEVVNEAVSIDPEMLEAWTVTSRLIYEYERAIHLPEKRLGMSETSF